MGSQVALDTGLAIVGDCGTLGNGDSQLPHIRNTLDDRAHRSAVGPDDQPVGWEVRPDEERIEVVTGASDRPGGHDVTAGVGLPHDDALIIVDEDHQFAVSYYKRHSRVRSDASLGRYAEPLACRAHS
jgi:hypothetical protein